MVELGESIDIPEANAASCQATGELAAFLKTTRRLFTTSKEPRVSGSLELRGDRRAAVVGREPDCLESDQTRTLYGNRERCVEGQLGRSL